MGDVLGGDTQMQLSRCVCSNLCVCVREIMRQIEAAVCIYVLSGECVTIGGTLGRGIVKV